MKKLYIHIVVGYAVAISGMLHADAPALSQSVVDFRRICDQAMDHMMDGMSAPSTNDVDRDFVQMMVPHHQAAIDMAMAELRHGKSEQLRRIAQEIIVDQQQEITAMDIAVTHSSNPASPSTTAGDGAALRSQEAK